MRLTKIVLWLNGVLFVLLLLTLVVGWPERLLDYAWMYLSWLMACLLLPVMGIVWGRRYQQLRQTWFPYRFLWLLAMFNAFFVLISLSLSLWL